MTTITQDISSLGSVPTTADPATFDARADTFLGTALPTLRTEINTWAGQANALGADVTTKSNTATTKAAEAAVSATEAEAAADAAAAASNADSWVSGQAYVAGDVVWSPIDYLSYRAKTSTSGTTDPSASADWVLLIPAPVEAGWTLLSTVTATDAATADIETTFDSTYDAYVIVADGVLPATNSAVLWSRLKIDGAYQAATYNYMISSPLTSTANSSRTQVSSSDTKIIMTDAAGSTNEALGPMRFEARLSNPASTAARKNLEWDGVGRLTSTNSYLISRFYGGGGYDGGTQALTGVRFLFSTGNIATGTFRLYGIRKT